MNFRVRKSKKATRKDRVLGTLFILIMLLPLYLSSRGKLPWQPLLIMAIFMTSFLQTFLSIDIDLDRPTFERFSKRLPIYISHVYLPLLLCALLSDKVEGTAMSLALMLLIPIFFETNFYLIAQVVTFIIKHRAMLEKIAVPVALIVFFAFYGLTAVGNPHFSMFIASFLPFSVYLALGSYECIWKHGYCFKTLPRCLLKMLIIMILPWWVLSSQTEMSGNSRMFVALEFLCLGLFLHFIMPRLLIKGERERGVSNHE